MKSLKVGARRGPSPRAEINVTPLVDVVLVLLIIFMVVTPFLRPIDVALPEAVHAEPSQELPVVLTLRADGTLYLADEQIEPSSLAGRLEARSVLVRADGDLEFGALRQVMEQLASAGVDGVDVATVPEDTEGGD